MAFIWTRRSLFLTTIVRMSYFYISSHWLGTDIDGTDVSEEIRYTGKRSFRNKNSYIQKIRKNFCTAKQIYCCRLLKRKCKCMCKCNFELVAKHIMLKLNLANRGECKIKITDQAILNNLLEWYHCSDTSPYTNRVSDLTSSTAAFT